MKSTARRLPDVEEAGAGGNGGQGGGSEAGATDDDITANVSPDVW